MSRKLKITEEQFSMIVEHLQEKSVERVVEYLENYYKASTGTYRKGGEYHDQPMIANEVDGEMMTPKSLFQHLKYKFNMGDDFLQQIVRDWYDGKFENNSNYSLSRNVKMV